MTNIKEPKEGWVRAGIDWDPKGLAIVRQAAAQVEISLEKFIKVAAEKEAERIVKSRKGLMDLNTAAEHIGVTRKEIIKLVGEGQLRARRIDGDWLVEQESVKEYSHQEPVGSEDMIELDLQELIEANALMGLEADGDAPESYSLSWCYVNQQGYLICPRAAWRKLGRQRVLEVAREAVRRFIRRREDESGIG